MTGRINRLAALLLGLAGLLPAYIYHGIAVPPGGRHAWVVTHDTIAVYHTSDFGSTWESQTFRTVRRFDDIVFVDSTTGWTLGEIGEIWHTVDVGDSWYRQEIGPFKKANRIRFSSATTGWVTGSWAMYSRTTNAGNSWRACWLDTIVRGDSTEFQGICLSGPDTCWLAAGKPTQRDTEYANGEGLVLRSTNGGDSWSVMHGHDSVYDFYDVAFFDDRVGCVAGGSERLRLGIIERTTDAGGSWVSVAVFPTGIIRTFCITPDRRCWACGDGGLIIVSSDQGLTWETRPTPTESTLHDIEFADVLRGMACGAGVILVTTNSGTTWTESRIGVAEPPAAGQERAPALRLLTNPTRAGPVFEVAGVRLPCLLAVYDPSGRLVMSAPVSGPHVALPARLRPGVYCARLLTSGTVATASFVVME